MTVLSLYPVLTLLCRKCLTVENTAYEAVVLTHLVQATQIYIVQVLSLSISLSLSLSLSLEA
jgi:hypothetical protein